MRSRLRASVSIRFPRSRPRSPPSPPPPQSAIFGSVTHVEIVEVIKAQTGLEIDKRTVTVPDISTVGAYAVSVKLHPEVTADFTLVVEGVFSKDAAAGKKA